MTVDWELLQQFRSTLASLREHGGVLEDAVRQGSDALSLLDKQTATISAAIKQNAHILHGIDSAMLFPERNWAQMQHAVQQQENALRQLHMAKSRRERWNERVDIFLRHINECPDASCKGELVKTQTEEDERISKSMGPRYDLECGKCRMVVYLPPMLFIKAHGDEYYRAANVLRSSQKNNLASVSVFLAHQASESYLKSLGTCSLYPKTAEGEDTDDDDEEFPVGPALERRNHDLQSLLDSLYPSVKDRVSDYGRDDSGNELAVGELIEAIPKKTSEYFRYGFLLNETYGNAVIHTNGDVKVDGRNVTHMEFRLCALLKAFVQEEAWW